MKNIIESLKRCFSSIRKGIRLKMILLSETIFGPDELTLEDVKKTAHVLDIDINRLIELSNLLLDRSTCIVNLSRDTLSSNEDKVPISLQNILKEYYYALQAIRIAVLAKTRIYKDIQVWLQAIDRMLVDIEKLVGDSELKQSLSRCMDDDILCEYNINKLLLVANIQ